MTKTMLTGDRPTGPLHLGHYVGSLQSCVRLQKRRLVDVLEGFLAPIRTRRAALAAEPGHVAALLRAGTARGRAVAQRTLADVRAAMGVEPPAVAGDRSPDARAETGG